MYNRLAGQSLKEKMSSISPICTNAQTHATALLFQTAATSLWNGTSIISLYFCLLFKGRIFWQAVRRQVFETQSKTGGREGDASTDHTISNPQTLSTLKCHSCNQPFHLRAARSSTPATQDEPETFELQRFQAIRTFNSDNLYASVIFLRSPSPEDCCCCCCCRWGLSLLFPSWNAKSAGS